MTSAPDTGARVDGTKGGLERRCIVAGLIFAALGAAWIFESHTWPERAWHYHVPLAFAFGCQAAWVAAGLRGRRRVEEAATLLLALGLIALRMRDDFPISGHGILGALLAWIAPWRWLALLCAAILVQAAVTKAIRGDDVYAVPLGMVAGLMLARALRDRPASLRSA